MKSRSQQFLDAITANDPSLLPTPITREERFLHALSTGEEIEPTTYEEQFMQAARAFKGTGGSAGDTGGSFADVTKYTGIAKHPSQAVVDTFLNTTHPSALSYMVYLNSYNGSWFFNLLASYGSHVTISGSLVKSDVEMGYLESSGSSSVLLQVDHNSNSTFKVYEVLIK